MWEKLRRVWQIRDLRMNLLFVIGMLTVFRIVAHIPVPGVNAANLQQFLAGNQIFGLLNIFSGGTIENFSIVMLGVGPYITASIIFQLMTMVVPRLEELSKEGEAGQQKINMYTRIATVPLAFLQGYGFLKLITQSQAGIFADLSALRLVSVLLTVTAGTVFLMWLGELITERKVGNGISLLIFAGIISGLPGVIQQAVVNYNPSDLTNYLLFVAIGLVTIAGVVLVSEGQRNIPVTYAKQARPGARAMGASTHLPLRVNMAGVIPIIFAISIILFPSMAAQFFVNRAGMIGNIAKQVLSLFQNQLFYGALYFLLVFGFTYFYTAIVFQPNKIAENLQRQGGFIPGIRPGKQTEEYLGHTMTRLIFSGALFLAVIAVLPIAVQYFTKSQSLVVGGTSLLIVVSVAIETAKQIESQLTMHEYDSV
jgi:preprotein translocase subunit SecY